MMEADWIAVCRHLLLCPSARRPEVLVTRGSQRADARCPAQLVPAESALDCIRPRTSADRPAAPPNVGIPPARECERTASGKAGSQTRAASTGGNRGRGVLLRARTRSACTPESREALRR